MSSTTFRLVTVGALVAAAASALTISAPASAEPSSNAADRATEVVAHWTPERVAAAQPRDLVIDERGLGYLRRSDGGLEPYGHQTSSRLVGVSGPTAAPVPKAPPSGGDDSQPPTVSNVVPAGGATIGGSAPFSATVTDESGVKSVSFVIVFPNGQTQSFTPGSSNGVYSIVIEGFSAGEWGWYIVARDNTKGRGNEVRTPTLGFTVSSNGGDPGDPGDPGDDVVVDDRWTAGGDVQLAAGRILFEMPTVQRRGKRETWTWNAYVCSGTVVTDTASGKSTILTAAHCVFDDVNKVFAQNVLFIPGQDDGGADGTDSTCTNDPIGCWTPSHGMVDNDWASRQFPNNVEWDYAYYVVPDAGAHAGSTSPAQSLSGSVNELTAAFTAGSVGEYTHALGYSYARDPEFRYCAETAELEDGGVDYWLPNCGLTGGSSGGPWVQPMDESAGTGPIVSVNSWGYQGQPGMAGPLLDSTARCVLTAAEASTPNSDRGTIASCP